MVIFPTTRLKVCRAICYNVRKIIYSACRISTHVLIVPRFTLTPHHHSPLTPVRPKRRRGRPRTFDEARRQTLCTLISIGLSRNEACRQVGVKPNSVVSTLSVAPASSRRDHASDYCSENPPLLHATAGTKTIIAAPNPIIVSKPP
jgi:hypothetical protein